MADTRCANPEYQLDVDTMMIEYVVYHAVEAKLKSLKQRLRPKKNDDECVESTSVRLIHIFDTLIRLFKHNHPKLSLSEGATFNIKILEFLILCGQLGSGGVQSKRLNEERSFNATYRRQWLDSWRQDPKGPGWDIKPHIVTSCATPEHSNSITLNDVLTRFMDISAETANAMGRVNDHWYRLAAEFTLQSAMERLQFLIDNHQLHHSDPSHFPAVVTWLSECFAWGIEPNPFNLHNPSPKDQKLTQHLQDQILISAIFKSQSQTSSPNPPTATQEGDEPDTHMTNTNINTTPSESPTWTRLRTKHHTQLIHLIQTHTPDSQCDCAANLTDLRRQHPLDEFLLDLHNYIDGIWCLNADNISGKPVLVQIEEGGLVGLDEREFEGFLGRVGLRFGSKGAGGKRGVRWMR